jgi:hypothetical protein
VAGYFCHTCNDECLNDSDCNGGTVGYCAYKVSAAHWVCGYNFTAG